MKIRMIFSLVVTAMVLSVSQSAIGGSESDTNTLYGNNAGAEIAAGTCCNTFIGSTAGRSDTTGGWNTFLGQESGFSNTTASTNTFVGQRAGYSNTEGQWNSFFGQGAGFSNTTADRNTFIGQYSGYSNTMGSCNTFLGEQTGHSNTGGQGNIFLGYRAGYNETGSDKLYIDNSDTATPLIWGDFNTNNVVIYGGFRAIASYSSSDGRLKRNVQPLELSLEKIASLQGVTYEWKMDEYPGMGFTEGKQIGLVAQKVEKEIPELVIEDKDGYKAVSYTRLTAVLVEAVKELKAQNEKQQTEIRKQHVEIERLRTIVEELKSS